MHRSRCFFSFIVLSFVVGVANLTITAQSAHGDAGSTGKAPYQTVTNFAPEMLKEHNEWRQKYKVPTLIWDDSLARDAQDFANLVAAKAKFPPAHRRNGLDGENFFWGTAGAFEPKDAVARWESENKNYNRETNTCAAGKSCVHFTQLVWSTTSKVGCGKATTPDRETDFFVCVYNPAGNLEGVGPFTVVPSIPTQSKPPTQPPNPTTTPSTRPAARRVGR
ncbi:MAG TPA: CAP domain-containing protein [Pyrinomonadaceae bacterium]|nr:CAP domain-containing protein [Pyrinomonadaceae bacterium]